jgi:hypothetical protein
MGGLDKEISVKCLSCRKTDKIPVNRYYCGKARCAFCGGSIERFHLITPVKRKRKIADKFLRKLAQEMRREKKSN